MFFERVLMPLGHSPLRRWFTLHVPRKGQLSMAKLQFPTERAIVDTTPGRWLPYGVGIDVHKEMVWACVLRPDYHSNQQSRSICKFDASYRGLAAMRVWLEQLVPEHEKHFLVESTGTYHFPVVAALQGWVATVINAQHAGSAKKKTDRWDAQKLAHHDMAGTFPAFVLPLVSDQALRVAMRRLVKIKRTITRNLNAIRTRGLIFGVRNHGYGMSGEGWDRFRRLAVGTGPYVVPGNPQDANDFQQALAHAAALPRLVHAVNQQQVDEIERLRNSYDQLLADAIRLGDAGGLLLLRSVPHVGDVAALTFLGEVGRHPLRRFASIRGIVAYAGFDPSKKVSADRATSHVPCAGNKHLRRVFLQLSGGVMLAKGTSGLAEMGQSVAASHGKKGWHAGVNAVGRKLIRYCSAVLIHSTPFAKGMFHGKAEANRVLSRLSVSPPEFDDRLPLVACGDCHDPSETEWEE